MPRALSLPRPVLLTLALLFAGATILYSVTWMYAVRWERQTLLGIALDTAPITRASRITTVGEGSAAERAGLLVDDRIVAVNGRPLDSPNPFIDAVSRGQPGDVVTLMVERSGEAAPLTIVATLRPRPPPTEQLTVVERVALELTSLYPVLFVVVGVGVLLLRLEDRNAWLLALLFAGFIAAAPLVNVESGIPPPLRGFALAYNVSFACLVSPLFYYFFAVFPVSSPIDRRLPWLKHALLVPVAVVSVAIGLWVFVAGSAQPLRQISDRTGETGLLIMGLGLFGATGLGFVSLVWNAVTAGPVDARRKTRVIVVGTLVGFVPITLLNVYSFFVLGQPPFALPVWVWAPCVILLFLIPLSFAYAVVRHRVLGIPQLLRLGLQYALARRLLLSLVPVVAAVLILDLLLHGDQPLIDVVRARGWAYGVLAGLALVAQSQRQRWLGALDRTFFRERYDAQRLLGDVVEEVRQAQSFDQVAPRAVARIEAALHAEFVAVLRLGSNETSYRNVASAPVGQAPPALSADSKLVSLVRVLGKPLDTSLSTTSWLTQQLPHDETNFLRRSHIELLVPIASAPDRTQALIALGPKRSEEPYTGEDLSFLVAIASSLALLLERPVAAPVPVTDAFAECPECGTCYDTGVATCSQDRAALTAVRFSRLLSDRYRLDRRLGRGGMGTVYEATDTALERRVATKVIREDLVGSAEAAQRFQHEARATAAFAHPNVVTVHDFGIATGTRAFLVMELLAGTNLRDAIKRDGRLPAARTLEILRSVCAAVDAAHGQQLVHRDLKPENIFLARSPTGETPKVLDFGIAKFVSSKPSSEAETGAGILLGTWQYMSPQQLRGGTVERAWDVWALGVVTYEMLTGAQPFAASTVEESHRAVLASRFTPLEQHLPDTHAAVPAFFERAFASDAAARPSSARALFEDLERALA